MTDELDGKENGVEIRRRFDQGVFLIGVGLREKDIAFEQDAHRYPYSANFRHGLNIIAALCAECAGEETPCLLDGLSESSFIRDYCTRNVVDWTEGWSEESRAAILRGETADLGPLADVEDGFFVPTDDCFDLILHAESDVLGAYQERRVYEFLRGGTQQHYVLGRRILVRNPILSRDEYVAIKAGRRDFSGDILDQGEASSVGHDWIVGLLDMAYEEVFDGMKVCPRCGWTMAKRGRQPYCSMSACCDILPSDYESLRGVSAADGEVPDYFTDERPLDEYGRSFYCKQGLFSVGGYALALIARPHVIDYTLSFKNSKLDDPSRRYAEKTLNEYCLLTSDDEEKMLEYAKYAEALRGSMVQLAKSDMRVNLPAPLHLAEAMEEYIWAPAKSGC